MGMDNIVVSLMVRFLKNNFPVVRLKISKSKKFKRGVDIDGKKLLLPSDSGRVYSEIFNMLKSCYAASDHEIRHVISNFYNLK